MSESSYEEFYVILIFLKVNVPYEFKMKVINFYDFFFKVRYVLKGTYQIEERHKKA